MHKVPDTVEQLAHPAFAEAIDTVGRAVGELAGVTLEFRRTHDRWPQDYEELLGFIAQEDRLCMRDYKRVKFRELAEDAVEIEFVVPNFERLDLRMTLTARDI